MGKCINFLLVVCVILVLANHVFAITDTPRPFGTSNEGRGDQLPLSVPRPISSVARPSVLQPRMRTNRAFVVPENVAKSASGTIPMYNPQDFPSGPRQFDYAEAFQDLPLSSPGRWLHTGVVVGNKMYIYGGITAYSDKLYNDLWLYDYRMSSWAQLQRSYIPPMAPGESRPKDIPTAPSYKRMPEELAIPKPGVPVYDLPYTAVMNGIGFASKTANLDSDFEIEKISQTPSPQPPSTSVNFMELQNIITKTIDPKSIYPELLARTTQRNNMLRQQYQEQYRIQNRKNNPSFNNNAQPSHDWATVPNDLWEYDLDLKTWKCVATHGEHKPERGEDVNSKPFNRWLHTAVNVDDHMIIFGGSTNEQKIMGDLWVFNPASYKWTPAFPQAGSPRPLPRQGHCAASIGNMMYIFGGISYGYEPFNDVWAYDAVNNVWTELSPNQPHEGIIPRWLTSCTAVEDAPGKTRFFVFGGVGKEYVPMNDFNVFEIEKKTWSPMVASDGNVPSPRMLHNIVHLGSRIYIVGGMANNIPFDDLHYYDLNHEIWNEVLPSGAYPFARGGASVAKITPIAAGIPDRPIYGKFNIADKPTERWSPRYRKIWNQNNFFVMFGGVGTVQL